MKNELFEALSALHQKVADLKFFDRENAALLRRYSQEFEALGTRLLTFSSGNFKSLLLHYQNSLPQGFHDVDVHDDTADDNGFYASVASLNNHINDSIEIINSI